MLYMKFCRYLFFTPSRAALRILQPDDIRLDTKHYLGLWPQNFPRLTTQRRWSISSRLFRQVSCFHVSDVCLIWNVTLRVLSVISFIQFINFPAWCWCKTCVKSSLESKSQAAAEYTALNQNILCQIKQKLGLHQLTQTPNTKYVFVTTRRGN